MKRLSRWLDADERVTDARGWSANLDIFRIVFLSFAVLPWAIRNLSWIINVMPGLPRMVWSPVSFYQAVPLGILTDSGIAKTLAIANLFLIVLGIVGFATRWSICGAALFSLYLFGLTENQGKIDHMHHLIWFLALLAAGPTGRFLSVDSLRNAVRNADSGEVNGPRYGLDALWTLRFIWVMLGLLYLIPGLAKLDKAMVAHWATAANLEHIFWRKWLEVSLFVPGANPPLRIDHLPWWLIELSGAGVIAFETGFLFVVLFRKLRVPAAVAGLGFHVGNGLALEIWFTTLLPAYVALIDWCALGKRLGGTAKSQLIVVYDGQCRFCRRTVAVLKSLDLFSAIALRSIESSVTQTGDSGLLGISPEELERDLHALDGATVYTGYEAYVVIAERIPVLWPLSKIMRWRFVATEGRNAYRRTADSRHCSIERRSTKALGSVDSGRLVLATGLTLVVLQTVISFMMYASSELSGQVAKLPRAARSLIADVSNARPVWPFTYYPTFSYATGPEAILWQVHWLVNGREVCASPSAYENLIHNSGAAWSIVSDPEELQQPKSLDLVRALWSNEPASIRPAISDAKVYQVTYQLGPARLAPGTVVGEKLFYDFPSNEFSR